MLADSEMQVFPTGANRLDTPRAIIFQCGLVRRSKIRRTTEEPGDILCKNVQHFSGCLAPGDSLWIGEEDGKVAIPPIRKFAPLHEINFGRELGIFCAIFSEEVRPLNPGLCAACAHTGLEVFVDPVRHEKFCVLGPSISALREANLVISQ